MAKKFFGDEWEKLPKDELLRARARLSGFIEATTDKEKLIRDVSITNSKYKSKISHAARKAGRVYTAALKLGEVNHLEVRYEFLPPICWARFCRQESWARFAAAKKAGRSCRQDAGRGFAAKKAGRGCRQKCWARYFTAKKAGRSCR